MTIYRINKERQALDLIIPYLHRLYADFTNFRSLLTNEQIELTTLDMINKKTDWDGNRESLSVFKSANETWFDSTYSSYSDALDGAISSLSTIVSAIDTSIENNYTDADTSKPILTDLEQNHRNGLATLIEQQLE